MHTRACILANGARLALALVLVCPAASRADEPANARRTDLAGFLHDTDDLSERIAAADPNDARAIADSLPQAWRIHHGTDDITVSAAWIAAPLRQAARPPGEWEKARTALAKRVAALHDEALELQAEDEDREPGDAAAPETQAARTALRDVLARSEFKQREDAAAGEDFSRRIQRWIVEPSSRPHRA